MDVDEPCFFDPGLKVAIDFERLVRGMPGRLDDGVHFCEVGFGRHGVVVAEESIGRSQAVRSAYTVSSILGH